MARSAYLKHQPSLHAIQRLVVLGVLRVSKVEDDDAVRALLGIKDVSG